MRSVVETCSSWSCLCNQKFDLCVLPEGNFVTAQQLLLLFTLLLNWKKVNPQVHSGQWLKFSVKYDRGPPII